MKLSIVNLVLYIVYIRAQIPHNSMCKALSRNPRFNIDLVVGPPWRTYYSWVMNMGDRCFDMTFVKATKQIIDRISIDMNDYIRGEIDWDRASLVVTKVPVVLDEGTKPREILLFPEKGNPGGFEGVINSGDRGQHLASKNSLPMAKYILKFFRQRKFLLMADCYLGIATLMARSNQTIYRSEVLSTAADASTESGFPVCESDINNTAEIVGLVEDSNKV